MTHHDSLCEMSEYENHDCFDVCTPKAAPSAAIKCICDRLKKAHERGTKTQFSSVFPSASIDLHKAYLAGAHDALNAMHLGLTGAIQSEISDYDQHGLLAGLKYAQDRCISAIEKLNIT